MATSLTLRSAKGSALTFTEVDDNFSNLKTTADAAAVAGAVTSSGLTMATNRLLGRTSASTGAVQEIVAGSGLALSAGQLEVNFTGYLTEADAASTYQPISSMSGYLTSSTAASTYQTQASMSSYLTTSDAGTTYLTQTSAASTYQPISGMSSYLTTADAGTTYLTQTNAASTYQTQAGMSSYLTTSTASSTYQTQAGMSSYLTTADAGTTYLTQTNAASTYQTQSGMSSYLTTATAASTYQTQSGMSSYLTTSSASSTYQPLDGDLTAIAAISTSGVLKRTGSNTWSVVTAPTGDIVGTSDTQTLTNKTLTAATLGGKSDFTGSIVNSVTAVAASAIDCSAGNFFTKTASGALSWSVSNVPSSRAYSFILELTNGGTGAQTWFSGIKWPGGTAPTLVASGVDILGFITDDGGTTWRGVQLMKDSK